MTYSYSKPTKPGWYWCRNKVSDSPSGLWEAVVHISRHDDGLRARWMSGSGDNSDGGTISMHEAYWSPTAMWAGPLKPPRAKAMKTNEELGKEIVSALLEVARKEHPQYFRGYFMGAIVSNVLGNLPEEYWREFKKCSPCGEAMCDCHLLAAQVMPTLEIIRQDHNEHTPRQISE